MQKTSTVTVPFMLLGILFNICLVASNLLETKVIQVFGITATAGLIVFPISYIINDCIAEVWGFKKARLIIWSGFISNFLVIGFAQLAVMLPAAPFWEGEEGFNFGSGNLQIPQERQRIISRVSTHRSQMRWKSFLTAQTSLLPILMIRSCRIMTAS